MDILVATAHDFALLHKGQPIASGVWDDVLGAHVVALAASAGVVALRLALRDGTEFRARDDAPGWDDFLDAAESALPGMRARREWEPALHEAAPGTPMSVFARDA